MTIQEIAKQILQEKKTPLTARQISQIAYEEKRLIKSSAKDPIASLSATIEKNIRGNIYNNPRLIFLNNQRGNRLIGLPELKDAYIQDESLTIKNMNKSDEIMTIKIPSSLKKQLDLIALTKKELTFDETVVYLIKKGINESSDEICRNLEKEIELFQKKSL